MNIEIEWTERPKGGSYCCATTAIDLGGVTQRIKSRQFLFIEGGDEGSCESAEQAKAFALENLSEVIGVLFTDDTITGPVVWRPTEQGTWVSFPGGLKISVSNDGLFRCSMINGAKNEAAGDTLLKARAFAEMQLLAKYQIIHTRLGRTIEDMSKLIS